MWSHLLLLSCAYTYAFASSFGHVSRIGSEKIFYDVSEVEIIFKEFLETFNKQYDDEAYKYRLDLFKKKLIKLNELNSEGETTYGINSFTDLTEEEMKSFCGMLSMENNTTSPENVKMFYGNGSVPDTVPDSLDWRKKSKVTPVKDQGNCGSCWAFSAIGNVESMYAIKNNKLLTFSEQQIVDCDVKGEDRGCDGGMPTSAFEYIIKNKGIELESDYPYRGNQSTCSFDKTKVGVQLKYYGIIEVHTEESLKMPLANYGPFSIAIAADSNFQHYTGGIYDGTCADNLTHAVLLVGYGTENNKNYWIIKNSWGSNWGEKGYVRVIMGKHKCAIGTYQACAFIK